MLPFSPEAFVVEDDGSTDFSRVSTVPSGGPTGKEAVLSRAGGGSSPELGFREGVIPSVRGVGVVSPTHCLLGLGSISVAEQGPLGEVSLNEKTGICPREGLVVWQLHDADLGARQRGRRVRVLESHSDVAFEYSPVQIERGKLVKPIGLVTNASVVGIVKIIKTEHSVGS